MPQFEYRALNPSGTLVVGRLEAVHAQDLSTQLARLGLTLVRAIEKRQAKSGGARSGLRCPGGGTGQGAGSSGCQQATAQGGRCFGGGHGFPLQRVLQGVLQRVLQRAAGKRDKAAGCTRRCGARERTAR